MESPRRRLQITPPSILVSLSHCQPFCTDRLSDITKWDTNTYVHQAQRPTINIDAYDDLSPWAQKCFWENMAHWYAVEASLHPSDAATTNKERAQRIATACTTWYVKEVNPVIKAYRAERTRWENRSTRKAAKKAKRATRKEKRINNYVFRRKRAVVGPKKYGKVLKKLRNGGKCISPSHCDPTSDATTEKIEKELREQYTAARKGKSAWSKKALARLCREISHHDLDANFDTTLCPEPLRWSPGSVSVVSAAAEAYITDILREANLLTLLKTDITLNPQALRLCVDLRALRNGEISKREFNQRAGSYMPNSRSDVRKQAAGKAPTEAFRAPADIKAELARTPPVLDWDSKMLPKGCTNCQDGIPWNPQMRWKRGVPAPPERPANEKSVTRWVRFTTLSVTSC